VSNILQAAQLDELLQRDDLPDDVRQRLAYVAGNLRQGVSQEITPPNIPIDEPIPGRHARADEARASSPTGDLPRSDRAPAPAPEEIVPPHEFGEVMSITRARSGQPPPGYTSVGDLNPDNGGIGAGRAVDVEAMAGSRNAPPPMLDVEAALPAL
jgi:hypothetical protein